jgi:hypothetical protein
MKRFLNVLTLVMCAAFVLAACGATAPVASESPEEANDVNVATVLPEDGSTEQDATEPTMAADETQRDNAATPPGETGVVLGNPLLAQLPDAVVLTVNPTDGKTVANDPLNMLYESDMSIEDAQADLEGQYTAAGYTYDPAKQEKPGVVSYTFISPADMVNGKPVGFCIAMLLKAPDAAAAELMKTEKLLVIYTCVKL